MKELEISIVPLSYVATKAETIRIDSAYYLKKYIFEDKLIDEKSDSFKSFSDLQVSVDASAFYAALEPLYGRGDYPFIRVGDVKRHIDFEGCIKLPKEELVNYPTLKHAKKGDIVLTKGGTVGMAGLVTRPCCVSRDLIFINSSVLSEKDQIALFLYLSSNFAYDQLIRSASQSVQPHLTIKLVREIPVFVFSESLKNLLMEVYLEAAQLNYLSHQNYLESQTVLLNVLGLTGLKFDTKQVNIKSLSESYGVSARLDAEFFQPKFDIVENIVSKKFELKPLSDFLTFNQRGRQPLYAEVGLPVINSRHVQTGEVVFSGNRFAETRVDGEEQRIQKGDVLINGTGVGTIGRAAPYLFERFALPDNHVTILRTDDLDTVFLSVYLNSLPGQLQVEKYFKGSSGQIELYPKDIGEFYMPVVDIDLQREIAGFATLGFDLKRQSEFLLEGLKAAISAAISRNEESAMELLKELMTNAK